VVGRCSALTVRFDDSACVLLNAKGEMMGTRIAGPVSALLRDAEGNQPGGRWAKILAMAPKVRKSVVPNGD
jgi:large subunit ribosomal protein L14